MDSQLLMQRINHILKIQNFINMSNINNERFIFTGGVTAYQSEIDFKNVKFKK